MKVARHSSGTEDGKAPLALRVGGTGTERGGILTQLIVICVVVALCGILYLGRHPLLRAAGRFWVINDAPAPSDTIVILSDDNYYGNRASKAAELYRAGWTKRVVASGRMLRPYAGIAELMEHDLEQRGVPEQAIVRFPHHATDTLEEAEAVWGFIRERGWRRILVVTSNYHTRRARFIFRHVFPEDIQLRVIPARDTDYDPDRWWQSREGVKIFLHETVGYLVAMWEVRHRNSRKAAGIIPWAAGGGCGLRTAWVFHSLHLGFSVL